MSIKCELKNLAENSRSSGYFSCHVIYQCPYQLFKNPWPWLHGIIKCPLDAHFIISLEILGIFCFINTVNLDTQLFSRFFVYYIVGMWLWMQPYSSRLYEDVLLAFIRHQAPRGVRNASVPLSVYQVTQYRYLSASRLQRTFQLIHHHLSVGRALMSMYSWSLVNLSVDLVFTPAIKDGHDNIDHLAYSFA